MGDVISLDERRDDEWYDAHAFCAACRSLYPVVVPGSAWRRETDLLCDGCGARGQVMLARYEMWNAVVVYETPDAEPRAELLDEEE